MTHSVAGSVNLETPRQRTSTAPVVVATGSVAAAAIHLWVVPTHLEQWWAYGAFFLVVAGGQLLFAPIVLWRARPWLLVTGVAANVAVVLVWMFSRTSGLPIGPPLTDSTAGRGDPALGGYGSHASGAVEAVGPLDFTASAVELVIVLALVSMLPPTHRRHTVNALLAVGVTLWGLYLFGVVG